MDHYRLLVVAPATTQSDAVFSAAIMPAVERVNQQTDFDVEVERPEPDLHGIELAQSLHRHLSRADLVLCDITNTDANVMYEIGYARSRDTELIVIRQPGTDTPEDISDKNVTEYEMTHLSRLSSYLETAIVKVVESVRTLRRSSRESYAVTCFQDRQSSDLGATISSAKSKINILETNVVTVVDTYGSHLKAAIESNRALRVRVLTLDPDSSFVNNRAMQLGVPVAQYRMELHDAIRRLQRTFDSYTGRFTLRIYDDFPTQITFIVDEVVYSCSIARGNRSRQLCTFRLNTYDPGAERSFEFHFEAVWQFGRVYVSVQ